MRAHVSKARKSGKGRQRSADRRVVRQRLRTTTATPNTLHHHTHAKSLGLLRPLPSRARSLPRLDPWPTSYSVTTCGVGQQQAAEQAAD